MEISSNKILEYKRINESTDEILAYIDRRRKGISDSLRTKWYKFNRLLGGGLEENTLYSIAGVSGGGKTSFMNNLVTDILDTNNKDNIVVLSFNFEMRSSRIVGKTLSYKLHKSTTDLYSTVHDVRVTDDYFEKIQQTAKELKTYNIYYVDKAGTVEDIRNTILYFNNTIAKDKWLIVTLDHTLLTKGRSGENERAIISDLQYMFMEIKKYSKITILQLSQLNREIETPERINNPYMHFPMRRDIFAADSVYQCSDVVMVIHRPELLQLEFYGVNKLPVKNLIYLHVIKAREGELGIIPFENNLRFNRIDETDIKKKDESQLALQI